MTRRQEDMNKLTDKVLNFIVIVGTAAVASLVVVATTYLLTWKGM